MQKDFFWSFRNFCLLLLLPSCAVIKAKYWFFSTQCPSSSSLCLLYFPFCSFLTRYSSPRECICVSAEKPCIFCSFDVLITTWRANYAQRFPLQAPFVTLQIPAATPGSSNLALLTTTRRDAARKTPKNIKDGKICSAYQTIYHCFNYVSQSQAFIWVW